MSRNHTISYNKDFAPTPGDLNYVMDTFGSAIIRHGEWFENDQPGRPIFSSDIDGSPIVKEVGYAVLCDGAHIIAHAPDVADTFNIAPNHAIKMAYTPQLYEVSEPTGMIAAPDKFRHANLLFSMGDLYDIEYMLLRDEKGSLDPLALCTSDEIAEGESIYLDGTPGKLFETSYQLEYSQVVCRALGTLATQVEAIQDDVITSDLMTRKRLSPQVRIAQQGGL